MMRKLKLYIAASLNGKIATTKGEVDWLDTIPNPEGSDYGYSKFYESILFCAYCVAAFCISIGIRFRTRSSVKAR